MRAAAPLCVNPGSHAGIPAPPVSEPADNDAGFFRRALGVFAYSRRALELVWTTNRSLTLMLAVLTLFAGVLPAVIAWIGQLIVDAVVAAMSADRPDVPGVLRLGWPSKRWSWSRCAACQRGISACQSLLRAQLGQRVNVMILEKALTLAARALRGLRVLRQADAGAARGVEPAAQPGQAHLRAGAELRLARQLRRAAVRVLAAGRWCVLVLAGLPAFIAEAKFSGDAFRLFRWRSPETRMQIYLETVHRARRPRQGSEALRARPAACSSATARSSASSTARTAS